MRRRRRPRLQVEIVRVPTQAGVPAGDLNPYREMDDEEREAVLLDSLARILRECAKAPAGKPGFPSGHEAEARLDGRFAENHSAGSAGGHLLPRVD